jgi:hypothetical protein
MKKIGLIISLCFIAAIAYGATTFTTNYQFNKPGDGDRNFGSLIRDNWDKVDTQLNINSTASTDHIDNPTGAHAATAISTSVGANTCTTSINVQDYLDCLDGLLDPGVSGVVLIAGSQTITGAKTFNVTPIFPASPSGILNTDVGGAITASTFGDIDPLTTKGDILTFDTDTVRFPVGTDGTVLTADSTTSEGIAWANTNPRWRKFTVDYSDLSSASNSFSVTIFSLLAKEGLEYVLIHHTTAFSGGSISAYTIEVGQTGDSDDYAKPFDVFQASGNTVKKMTNIVDLPNFGTTTDVTVTGRTVGDTLDNATVGSVDIYVRTFILP